ncbi:hypothetical protein SNEBB_010093 [Seison nebaliae]|nr:hypothetical protein SNEBB_010093 [Seison nebaliae]
MVQYPFPINNRNQSYKLISLSIKMFKEQQINLHDLPKNNKNHELVNDCVNGIMERTREMLRTHNLQILEKYIRLNSQPIKLVLIRTCRFLLARDTFLSFYRVTSPVHAFSLVQRQNSWYLMNDDFSLKINDIGQMTRMLKHESVAGALLETEEYTSKNNPTGYQEIIMDADNDPSVEPERLMETTTTGIKNLFF